MSEYSVSTGWVWSVEAWIWAVRDTDSTAVKESGGREGNLVIELISFEVELYLLILIWWVMPVVIHIMASLEGSWGDVERIDGSSTITTWMWKAKYSKTILAWQRARLEHWYILHNRVCCISCICHNYGGPDLIRLNWAKQFVWYLYLLDRIATR